MFEIHKGYISKGGAKDLSPVKPGITDQCIAQSKFVNKSLGDIKNRRLTKVIEDNENKYTSSRVE